MNWTRPSRLPSLSRNQAPHAARAPLLAYPPSVKAMPPSVFRPGKSYSSNTTPRLGPRHCLLRAPGAFLLPLGPGRAGTGSARGRRLPAVARCRRGGRALCGRRRREVELGLHRGEGERLHVPARRLRPAAPRGADLTLLRSSGCMVRVPVGIGYGRADEGACHQGIFPSVTGFLHWACDRRCRRRRAGHASPRD